jgi:hypothetical protein
MATELTFKHKAYQAHIQNCTRAHQTQGISGTWQTMATELTFKHKAYQAHIQAHGQAHIQVQG